MSRSAKARFSDHRVMLGLTSEEQWRQSFVGGFFSALRERLVKEEQAAIAEAPGALIAIGKAMTRTQKYLDRTLGGRGTQGSVEVGVAIEHNSAANLGYTEGSRVSLATNTVDGAAETAAIDGMTDRRMLG